LKLYLSYKQGNRINPCNKMVGVTAVAYILRYKNGQPLKLQFTDAPYMVCRKFKCSTNRS
jgi:hypothetical protein